MTNTPFGCGHNTHARPRYCTVPYHWGAAACRACGWAPVRNDIGAQGARALNAVLQKNTTLVGLNLRSCNIGPIGCEYLCEALVPHYGKVSRQKKRDGGAKSVKSETDGDARDGNGGDAGDRAGSADNGPDGGGDGGGEDGPRGDVSPTTTSPRSLDRGRTAGDDTEDVEMQLLSGNVFLRRLNLRDNGIGTAGCAALCEMLKANTTLVEIDLAVNNLNVGGAELVASMLKENTTVHTVHGAPRKLGIQQPDGAPAEARPHGARTEALARRETPSTCAPRHLSPVDARVEDGEGEGSVGIILSPACLRV